MMLLILHGNDQETHHKEDRDGEAQSDTSSP